MYVSPRHDTFRFIKLVISECMTVILQAIFFGNIWFSFSSSFTQTPHTHTHIKSTFVCVRTIMISVKIIQYIIIPQIKWSRSKSIAHSINHSELVGTEFWCRMLSEHNVSDEFVPRNATNAKTPSIWSFFFLHKIGSGQNWSFSRAILNFRAPRQREAHNSFSHIVARYAYA